MKKTHFPFLVFPGIHLILECIIFERKKKRKQLLIFSSFCLFYTMHFCYLGEFRIHKNSLSLLVRKNFLRISKCLNGNSNTSIHVLFTMCFLSFSRTLGQCHQTVQSCVWSVTLQSAVTSTGSSQLGPVGSQVGKVPTANVWKLLFLYSLWSPCWNHKSTNA